MKRKSVEDDPTATMHSTMEVQVKIRIVITRYQMSWNRRVIPPIDKRSRMKDPVRYHSVLALLVVEHILP